MTMCVFWKDKANNIHMATDSRLNNGISELDHCLKLSTLSCELYEVGDDAGTERISKGSVKLAISFCGGFVSAYTIKESLAGIINKMVFLPDSSEASLELIAEVAFKVYKKITTDVMSYSMGINGACSIYISGLCPLSHEVEMYKFGVELNKEGNKVDFYMEKCFQNETYIIDGSGASYLKSTDTLDNHVAKAYEKNQNKPLLDLLESVIADPKCNSVGGSIQYAKCHADDVILYSLYECKSGVVRYMRAGVDVNELMDEVVPLGVVIENDMIGRV